MTRAREFAALVCVAVVTVIAAIRPWDASALVALTLVPIYIFAAGLLIDLTKEHKER